MRVRSLALAVTAALAAAAVVAAGPAGPATGSNGPTLSAVLAGANEVPGPGDPDGSGTAEITFHPGAEEVCWTITTTGLAAFTGAHIHRGTATEAGPVVVHLSAAEPGCTAASRALITEILRDPSAFYVNVHTVEFRPGAIRGQLTR